MEALRLEVMDAIEECRKEIREKLDENSDRLGTADEETRASCNKSLTELKQKSDEPDDKATKK